jgi:hypothetical protein
LEGNLGNIKRIAGLSTLESVRIIPAFVAISINPIQKDMTPNIVKQSVTASFEESIAALVTSLMFPISAA